MLFDAYLVVDWSARSRPGPRRPTKDSIWLCYKTAGGEWIEYLRTRAAACTRILEILLGSERILVTMDFAYSYPAGLAQRLGVEGWMGLWDELGGQVRDEEDNSNNRFEVAAALNERLSGGPGPFWACPAREEGPHLTAKKTGLAGLPEYRLCEQRGRGAQSVWKLGGAGSVGSQSLLGVPWLAALRFDARLKGDSCVWPFETGLEVPSARIVHAEIYPSLIQIHPEEGEVKDAVQVRELARWFADRDRDGSLRECFLGPTNLTPEQRATIEREEGWILNLAY